MHMLQATRLAQVAPVAGGRAGQCKSPFSTVTLVSVNASLRQ